MTLARSLAVGAVRGWRTTAGYVTESARIRRAVRQREREVRAYVARQAVRRLHIGAGNNLLSGWLNTDTILSEPGLVYMDATARFPFDDAVFDYVFSEHMIEHIDYREGLSMLQECRRVMTPGGRIRIATPCADRLVELYRPVKTPLQESFIRYITDGFMPDVTDHNGAFVVDMYFRGFGHRFLYDHRTLVGSLEQAGFSGVVEHLPGESDDELLRRIECGARVHGEEINGFATMVFEAVRPQC